MMLCISPNLNSKTYLLIYQHSCLSERLCSILCILLYLWYKLNLFFETMETIYESDFQRYKIDKESNFLQADWFEKSTEMSDQDFKDEMEKELEYVEKFQIKHYLIDTLNFRFIINPDLQTWADVYVNTKLDKLGLKKLAYIVSQDYIAQLSINQTMSESVKQNYQTSFFASIEEAKAWLSE